MTNKMKVLFLIITSLFVYLSWGKESAAFLFQMEYEIISKLFTNPLSALHPFTIIPLLGQILLLISLFQKTPNVVLLKIGIGCLLFLIGFVLIVGLLSRRISIIVSTLPFITLAYLTLKSLRTVK
ncbi:MAG: hypothetical protein RL516_2258 [Bacteroidota bacterium]|jgi:hypothetical protein